MKKMIRAAVALSFGLATSVSSASVTNFPAQGDFTFTGSTATSGVPSRLTVCPQLFLFCQGGAPISPVVPGAAFGLASDADQPASGAIVRGDMAALDPSGTATYHSLEFELHTRNFFSLNPQAHIAISPRGFLPHRIGPGGPWYNNYPPFSLLGSVQVPYAFGNGIMLGNVNCHNRPVGNANVPYVSPPGYSSTDVANGIGFEHFLGPSLSPENATTCYPAGNSANQMSFQDNQVYLVKVFVRQEPCNGLKPGATCRWTAYRVQKTGAVFGPGSNTVKGGNDTPFVDTSGLGAVFGPVTSVGWSRLLFADQSAWFISHVFSNTNPSTNWAFEIRNLQTTVSNTEPAWFAAP